MTEKTPAKLLNDLIGGLSQASGACSQLVHMRQDPRFMLLRKTIDSASSVCKAHAQFSATKLNRVTAV